MSVAMATFNGSTFLQAQLDSIASQSLKPFEIIICDDGSTDNTVEIVEYFAEKSDISVTITRNRTRLGYADNFMKAASMTTGAYVCFSDQDDYWYPNKIEQSVRALRENDAMLTGHPIRLITADGKPKLNHAGQPARLVTQEITSDQTFAPNQLDPWGVFLGFTQTIDRRLLDIISAQGRGLDSHDFKKILPHDRWMYFLGTHFGRTSVIKETLADYRQHATNTYGAADKSFLDRFRIKIEEGPLRLKQFADLAAHRLEMLIAARNKAFAAEFDAAIVRWEAIHKHCLRRFDLYQAPNVILRGGYLLGGIFAGTYQGFPAAGLGPKRFVEDVTLGMLGQSFANKHLIEKPAAPQSH